MEVSAEASVAEDEAVLMLRKEAIVFSKHRIGSSMVDR